MEQFESMCELDNKIRQRGWRKWMLSSMAGLALPLACLGQSDNFDSGSLSSAWQQFYVSPALVSFTFPASGNGKALRIQANPYPPASFPAAAAISQTNQYGDFYVAVDLVDWAVEDQAVVVLAHWTPGGSTGLDQGTGMILNYDAAQDGDASEGPNRKGGEFQINTVSPGFAAHTLAACEMTLVPGRSYRFVFRGVGDNYTGQVYDLQDLTTPLATIKANDSTYPSGECGFLSFSRNGIAGTTDVTIDNYYAAASDPNAGIAPVLAHPVPGTPIVDSRVPTARWKNFHNPALGISFTAKTYTANVISAAATKLRLNGVDVSSQLTLSPDGTSISGSLPASALSSNAIYSAAIELSDLSGLLKSTNTFWFDTFTEAYLDSAGVKVIEAEDYNYSNGVYKLDPIPVSGMSIVDSSYVNGEGVGYYDVNGNFWITGTEGVDFHSAAGSPDNGWNDYRGDDAVMTGQGIRQEIEDLNNPDATQPWISNPYNRPNDNTRQKYSITNLVENLVIRTHADDWLNYTRSFVSNGYFVLLRAGAFSSTTATLSQVTSDPTQPSQTTSALGIFNIPNTIRRSNFQYIPLTDSNGLGAIVNLSGTNTVRLTMGGVATLDDRVEVLNYLLLVPAQVALQSASAVTGPYANDGTATVNVATRTITVPVAGNAQFYRLSSLLPLKITGISASGGVVTLTF